MTLLGLALAWFAAGPATSMAQQVGDAAADVKVVLGEPNAIRKMGNGVERWIYGSGLKVTLRNGIVAQVEGEARYDVETSSSPSHTTSLAPRDGAPSSGSSVTITAPPPKSKPAESWRSEPRIGPNGYPVMPGWVMGLIIANAIVSLIAGVIILIAAFKESILWGLGAMFVPLVGLIFVIAHWQETRKPFLVSLACSVMTAVAIGLSG